MRYGLSTRRGFTLIELLVVIAIIAIILGLLLPAVQKVREAAARMSCSNNLHQIAVAIHHYHDVNKTFPPGGVTEGPCCGTPSHTNWAIEILQYLEEDNLFKRYDRTQINESARNQFLRTHRLNTYLCPVDEPVDARPESGPGNRLTYAPGSYRGMAGFTDTRNWWDDSRGAASLPGQWRGALFSVGPKTYGTKPITMSQIRDGTHTTLLVGEYMTRTRQRRRTFWAYTYTSYNLSGATTQSRTFLPDYDECARRGGRGGSNPCKRAWGSFHAGRGVNFVFCDGHVQFLHQNLNMTLFGRLATIGAADQVSTYDF